MKTQKGFTLIELMIIVAIISFLAVAIVTGFLSKARDKAAVNAYKTEMQNIRRAVELCVGTGGADAASGVAGENVCGGTNDMKYPEVSKKCNAEAPRFRFFPTNPVPAGASNWHLTTYDSVGGWDCLGCRLECTVEQCAEVETLPGKCF